MDPGELHKNRPLWISWQFPNKYSIIPESVHFSTSSPVPMEVLINLHVFPYCEGWRCVCAYFSLAFLLIFIPSASFPEQCSFIHSITITIPSCILTSKYWCCASVSLTDSLATQRQELDGRSENIVLCVRET